ncbi:uncharacterized protein PITG_20086 [Phytophthora infestans T30-4]|uniref:PHD-type domain-containing protein n=1 Tax=Phytophthora infestans (strain T30-4) TaxID=403677 RepID=D0P0R0_PHYIT|nr:uncharacterized protein PITG_20086 [Phytophthora infestans T30-4]EEY53028.1 conserved hypothetical protein [Phytophthora infestans T30-4]|eukprot:XP_002896098.1 conserved hypothetical protein [Phytophthora infestans T30-4]
MTTPRVRFNWEDAVAQDRDLQRIDAFVKLTISKFPGQPAPRANIGRGSRYQPAPPAVKAEPPPTMVTTTPASNGFTNGTTNGSSSSGGSTPQFINLRDYQSESSSEVDTREVNPMDELSDFEGDGPQQQQQSPQQMEPQQPEPQIEHEEQDVDHSRDVEMEEEDEEEEEEEEETACEVCKNSDRENEIILCDDCNAEYHIFCLQPPLSKVPNEDEMWYCPKCRVKYPTTSTASVKEEQMRAAAESEGNATTDGIEAATPKPPQSIPVPDNTPTENDPTSIPIAQVLEGDPEKSNLLLVHACNCDDVKCTDPEFHVFCPHMKRFLRSVCWASHSEKWRTYRLARITAELFAYHAMKCTLPQCNVPLCVKIREEEIV